MTTSAKGQGARRPLAASAASKLGQRAGFTLSELLTTVIIVGLVTSLVAGGATLATNHFSRSVALSESFMLYSTLEQVLDNELSFTETIYGAKIGESNTYEVDGFQSWNYLFIDAPASAGEGGGEGAGAGSSVGTYYLMMVGPDGKGQDASVSSAFGQLAFCAQDGSSPNKILSPSSYNNNLVARVDSLVYDAASRLFTVRLLIAQAGDTGNPLVDETFTVRALNIIHLDGTAITLPPDEDKDDEEKKEDNSNFIVPNDRTTQFEAPVVKWENMQKNGAAVGSIILSENGSVYYVANNAIPANKTDLTIDGEGNSSDLLTVKMGADNEPLVVHADQVDNNYQFEQGTLCISNGTLYIATKKTKNPPKKDDGNWQVLSSAETKPIATSSSS